MSALLKLRAEDGEDAQVISAVLQDAIVPVCDMIFQPEAQNFVMVAQRLRRENGASGACERICCALTVKGVGAVQTQGIDLHDRARMLDLLAIMLEPDTGHLSLVFAGDARVRLALTEWQILAEDFGETWPAQCNPCHDDGMEKAG